MATNSVGIGLIGCGSRLRGMARRVVEKNERLQVVAAMDVSEESIAKALDLFPDARVHEKHEDVSNDPEVDWVMIGSYNCFLAEHTIAAFEAGKHVWCEKPLALTVEQCVAMREARDSAGKMFSLGLTLRYSPHYQAIERTVRGGDIGNLVCMEFNEVLTPGHGGFIHMDWRRKRELAGTHLLEKCCHDLDLANWIVGSIPVRVASFGGVNFFKRENASVLDRYERDEDGRTPFHVFLSRRSGQKDTPFHDDKDIVDHQVAILEYANGVKATFHASCFAGLPERRMYLIGTEGTLRGDVISGALEMKRFEFGAERIDLTSGAAGGHGGGDAHLVTSLASSMLDGTPPQATLEDGLRSAVAAFGVDEALDTGTIVDLRPMWDRAGVDVG